MDVYLSDRTNPLHLDPRNLFTLRGDLNYFLFDKADFVIVPKCGRLYVHFLQHCEEAGQAYQDVIFDHSSSLSRELLYARFAWAILNIVSSLAWGKFRFVDVNTPKKQEKLHGRSTAKNGGRDNGGRTNGSRLHKRPRAGTADTIF
jgi:hypothetical protein